MFYCIDCAADESWSLSLRNEIAECEVCGVTRTCESLPARLLIPFKRYEKQAEAGTISEN